MIELIIGLAKYIIFVFNFIFLVLGSLLILFGILPIVNGGYDSTYSKIVIAVGAFVFVVAFLGCCGAVRENKILLTAHAVIFIILFTIQMIGILVMVALNTNGYDVIDNKLNDYIYSNNTNEVNLMKGIEKWLNCCGINNSTDYTDKGLPLPGACCGESDDVDSHNEWTCTPGVAYTDGCSQKLREYIDDNFKYVCCIVIGLAIFEIFGAIFTLWTRDHLISKARNDLISKARNDLISKTRNDLILKTGDDLMSKTGDDLISKTGDDHISRTGDDLISQTGDDLISKTGDDLISKTGDDLISQTGDDPIYYTPPGSI